MKKVLVGMSGGVDSSTSALLLQKQGYEVIGATMNLFTNEENKDAKKVCEKLNIKHYTLNFQEDFSTCIINYFINEPNDFST